MLILCEEAMYNLLGSSQTFIGVLLTLNVLCLFLNKDNNFIYHLVINQNERFLSNLLSRQRQIETQISDFKNSDVYKQLQSIVSTDPNESGSIQISPEALKKAQKLSYDCSVKIFNYSTVIPESYTPFKDIEEHSEQALAPLFSLGFGLIVFLLDEIGRFILRPANEYTLSIYIFIFVAIAYWVSIWATFFIHPHFSKSEEKKETDEERFYNNIWIGSILKYIVCGAIYFLLLKWLPWQDMNQWGIVMLSLGTAIMPILTIGVIRLWLCSIKGSYSYIHVLGHLTAMAAYAAMITAIFYFCKPIEYQDLGMLVNVQWLRLVIVLFLLTNGILFPFLLPYLKCVWIFSSEKKEIKNKRDDISAKINEISNSYQALCTQIVSDLVKK